MGHLEVAVRSWPLVAPVGWTLRHRVPLHLAGALVAGASGLGDPIATAVGGLVAVALLGALVVSGFRSRGVSMAPALAPNTWGLLLGAPPSRIRAGDVVAAAPDGHGPVIKRVAGLGGDRLRFSGGGVARAVGDRWLDTGLAFDANQFDLDHDEIVEVPAGFVFLLGDHVGSVDSRLWGPVPRNRVVGRYVPWVSWGRAAPAPLSDADRADLHALRQVGSPGVERLEAVVAAGGCAAGHVTLALRRAWLEAGRPDAATDVLERAWERDAAVPEDRGLWTELLARAFADAPERALACLQRQLATDVSTPFDALLRQREATLYARGGQWSRALACADREGPDAFLAVRVSALLGLGRVDEAEARTRDADARRAWADPSHGPYYRALVHAARGEDDAAITALLEAIAVGFTDRDLLDRTPHLAGLRGSSRWPEVTAALAAR